MRQQLKLANFFEQLVFRPWIRGRFENDLLNVHETGLLEPGDVVGVVRDRTVVFFGGFGDDGGPVGERVCREEGGVVGGEAAVEFLEFEVAAGFGVSGESARSVVGLCAVEAGRSTCRLCG